MKVSEFINRCIEEGCAWSKGASDAGKPGYFVKCDRFNTITHFEPCAVLHNDWAVLWQCVVQGKDVIQMTRVVGYYSRIQNWNKSRKGELKARQAGNYKV